MCGITGAIWTDPRSGITSQTLGNMTDVLEHRGPDDRGAYFREFESRGPRGPEPGVALGFRRLSIIDLAGGHQPITNEDHSIWVVFNGEIYNFEALRHRLEGNGHQFQSRSDSETIVHLYEDEGLECFKHFNGMFAIAIWDSNRNRLVIARDRLGQKPVYYRHDPGRFVFASELKSLLQIPDLPRQVDPNAVDEYLTYQYIPYPNCILQGYRKLPPGQLVVAEQDRIEVSTYWEPSFQSESSISQGDAIERLRELMRSSVRLRMQSDVPLGAFLSGGVDSSLIVALMQEASNQPVKTFSIGFPVAEYDETRYARQVAKHLGTEHFEFQVTPRAIEILDKLAWHYDEPFADSSAIPTWYVSEMTRQHVTVALSGDGGDELFAGYPRYKAVRMGQWIDRLGPAKRLLGASMWQNLPGSARQKGLLRRFKRFSSAVRMSPLRRYLDWISIFNESRRAELYTDDFVRSLAASDPYDFIHSAWTKSSSRDPVTAISLTDLITYLPCDLNNKVDIASMAHGLECRQPFLDYRVVEFAAGLPIGMKFKRLKGKRILRKAFGSLLPDEIWDRPKMGFGVPLDHWFRDELKGYTRDVLLDPATIARGFFRSDVVEKLIEEHQSGVFDHSYRLWSLLVFELWQRQWIDSTPIIERSSSTTIEPG